LVGVGQALGQVPRVQLDAAQVVVLVDQDQQPGPTGAAHGGPPARAVRNAQGVGPGRPSRTASHWSNWPSPRSSGRALGSRPAWPTGVTSCVAANRAGTTREVCGSRKSCNSTTRSQAANPGTR